MHAKLFPSITLKEQLCQRTCQSMHPVDFEELGLSSKGRCSVLPKEHEPPQSTSRNKHTNNQSKGDIESILSIHYTVYFLPHTFVLGAFLVSHNLQLGTELFFFQNKSQAPWDWWGRNMGTGALAFWIFTGSLQQQKKLLQGWQVDRMAG